MNKKVSKTSSNNMTGHLMLAVMLLLSYLYYKEFAHDLTRYDGKYGFFQYTLNSHDHLVYLLNIDNVRNEGVVFNLGNDRGISQIYIFFSSVFPFLVDPDFSLISLFVNCMTLCGCYWLYIRICEILGLDTLHKLSFFVNFSLIYFAQLINKDMFTIFIFLLSCYLALGKKLYIILLLLPFVFLIRIQLAAFVLIFVFLYYIQKPLWAIFLIYISTSLLAGYMSVVNPIIGDESLGEGFSYFLVDFNAEYYIGYLLFNPLRVVQYIVDAYSSFYLPTETGGIDTAKLLRLPQLALIAILIKPLSTLITKCGYWMTTPARPLVLIITSYFLAWLMNPTVNARYVMLITPIVVLFALYARKYVRKAAL